ncbi:hypothetical protein [Streptomyces sp. NPDC088736]|uniref:hypothetical protein n=1 Tax=Streptomyces sp. NPDC088736 TaxID=3365881 RepID=UPI0038052AF4
MAGAFRIAEGYVEVTADESGYDRAMDRLKSKRNQVKLGIDLDDRAATTKLNTLLRARTVKLGVDLDDRAASTSLRNLAKDRRIKAVIELDDRTATAGLTRLARDRTVQLTARLDDTAVTGKLTALSGQQTVNFAPKISDAAYNAVKAKLDRLAQERTVNIRATADTRVAADEIRNLTARRKVRIGIDVDTRVAADDIANLTRRRQMTIQARADTAAANTALNHASRDRTANIRVRTLGLGALTNLGSAGSSGGGGLGILSSSIARIAALAAGALPTIASLGQSLAAMAPAALVAVPAVLSLGAAFAAIKIGTSGVGDAFKAAFAPATASAGAATKSTRQLENAQRSLAKAQQGVKDAEVAAAQARVQAARQIEDAQQNLKNTVQDVADATKRAADQVAQAERDLADAQRASRQAQLDLNDAREQAAQDLEDLNARLVDAQLDQRQKVLDLQDAEQNLAAVKAKGAAASKEDLDKAQLQYDRAVQGLSEQQTETARLQQQAEEANAAGVEGSKQVVDAKTKISDANRDVADKTKALTDAETDQARTAQDSAQKIAKAERDLADARDAARKAAVDGARQIADAHEAVADAARAMADAQTAGAAATNKTADALAKLSPNARSFVSAVLAQREAWRGLKLDVQDALFDGLGRKFTTMSGSILPSLKTGLTGTATVLNGMAKGAADAVTQLGKTGTLKKLFAGLNDGLKPLSKVPGQFITGLAQISVAASPAFKRITTASGGFFTRLSQQIDQSAKNGHLEKIIDQALDVAKQFGHLIGDIFGTLGNVMKAAAAGGGDALGALGETFKELRRITALPEVQKALTSIFQAINAIAKLVAGTLGSLIQAVLPLLAQVAPFVTALANQLGPVIGQLVSGLGEALAPIITALLPVLGEAGTLLIALVQAVMPLLKPIGDLLAVIVKAVAPLLKLFADNLTIIVGALVKFLVPVINALVPTVAMFGQLFGQIAPMFAQLYPALLPLIPPLAQLAVSLLTLAMQVITPLLPLITGLAYLLTTVLAGAINILVPVINTIVGALTVFTTAITTAVNWIVDKFKWLYDVLVGHSIIPDLVNAIIGWFGTLWTNTKKIFTELKNWVVSTWNALWDGARSKWNSFYSGFKTAMSTAWSWVKSSVTDAKNAVTNTWNSLWNGTKDKVTSIFSTINSKVSSFASGMRNAFTNLKNGLGTIWDGVRSKIASPVKFVVNTVYNNGIRKMWNSIAGKISSKITLPSIGLGFNKGGVVPGTGNRDTVPAMLTPGERILSNSQVAALGGHRGIDAMLGKDKPTRTGGNPSSQQERQREQAVPHFASGGIIGKVTSGISGAISSAASWTKDLVIGGLKSAAQKALSALVRPLINQIPGSGIGNLMRGLSNKAVDGMLSWFTNEDKKAVGGPAVQRALSWVKTQNGLPYQWAGNGNPSWDCSGLMSAIESVIRGERPHRRWATGSFSGSSGPSGWVRNLNSPFMIGITNAGVGHTAGTLAGMNVESSGGAGVHMGKSARGYNNSLFTSRWGFAPAAKYDSGGLLQPGATLAINKTRRPEAVLTAEEHAAFRSIVTNLSKSGSGEGCTINVSVEVRSMTIPTDAEAKRFAKAIADPVKEEIRQLEKSRRR